MHMREHDDGQQAIGLGIPTIDKGRKRLTKSTGFAPDSHHHCKRTIVSRNDQLEREIARRHRKQGTVNKRGIPLGPIRDEDARGATGGRLDRFIQARYFRYNFSDSDADHIVFRRRIRRALLLGG